MPRTLHVNGTTHEIEVAGDTPLLWVLREALGLTGTKYGCGIMACGACTVLLDGTATRTCALPLDAVGANVRITTIEGLPGTARDPVQRAWAELSVAQCGYCQSGMIMSAVALLARHPAPDDAQIAEAMTNLCRCGTYQQVRHAIRRAVALRDA